MEHLDLFSGIGGFALAAERVWSDVKHTFVENDPFCQAVLKKHWPNSQIYGDIRNFHGTRADLLTGGFPCQPFSVAGKQRGTADGRYLWPEMLRVIREVRPTWVIGENVAGIINLALNDVCADLEGAGYEVQPFVIPACALNAPHRRDRVWIVGHAKHDRRNGSEDGEGSMARGDRDTEGADENGKPTRPALARSDASKREGKGSGHQRHFPWTESWLEAATRLCTMDDGLPNGLVRPRGWRNAALKAAGNALVPQVAEQIMRAMSLIRP